jgi:GNAT superfamily N-acetyltransferase
MIIRPATPADREWIGNLLRERWHDTRIAAHGEVIDAAGLPGLVVDDRRGLATWRRFGADAELMTLDAVPTGCGVGTALIEALVAQLREQGCARLCLTTTNDNLSGLRFYMRRGFRLTALRPGAVDEARQRKPAISLVGQHGIPIHDELELSLALNQPLTRKLIRASRGSTSSRNSGNSSR